MTWIERSLRASDQKSEQDQRLQTRNQQEVQRRLEKARRSAAKDITKLIRRVTGETIKADRLVELPHQSSGTVYGVVNLDGVEFGIHYYTTGNNYFTDHTDLVVLQRDYEKGLWILQVTHNQADLGRVLRYMGVKRKTRYGAIGPGSFGRKKKR